MAFVVALAVNTGATATAAPATATPASTDSYGCPEAYACFWDQTYMYGEMGKLAGDNTNWTAFSQSHCATGTWNDCARSLDNNGDYCPVFFWTSSSYNGSGAGLDVGNFVVSLALDWGSGWDRTISSNHWCTPR